MKTRKKFLLFGTNLAILQSLANLLRAKTRFLKCTVVTNKEEALEQCRWHPEVVIFLDPSIACRSLSDAKSESDNWEESVLTLARLVRNQPWGKDAFLFLLYKEALGEQFEKVILTLVGNNGQVFQALMDWGANTDLILDEVESSL